MPVWWLCRQGVRGGIGGTGCVPNALDIAEIVRQLQEEGYVIDPEVLAHISPYLTEHIRRFGEYSTHELGPQPEAYDPWTSTSARSAAGTTHPVATATNRRHDPPFAGDRAAASSG